MWDLYSFLFNGRGGSHDWNGHWAQGRTTPYMCHQSITRHYTDTLFSQTTKNWEWTFYGIAFDQINQTLHLPSKFLLSRRAEGQHDNRERWESIIRRQTSCWCSQQRCNAVCPLRSSTPGSAPPWRRACTTTGWCVMTAKWRGVWGPKTGGSVSLAITNDSLYKYTLL